ncbi:MAG: glycosyltransferase family 4 protein [Pseudomonadota bacterium]
MSALPDLTNRTILQVIPALDAGGAEQTTIEVADAVVQSGGRALVASGGGRLASRLKDVGGELVPLNLSSKNPVILASNAARLASLIETEAADIVHARSRAPAWSAIMAARRTNTRFVTTYHGIYSGERGLKRRYNSVMARGDRVIANSNWTANHVRRVHGISDDRLVVIPRGVDLEAFDPAAVEAERIGRIRSLFDIGPDETRKIALLPARLTPWKGQMVAIKAMSVLSEEERRGLRLVIAGDDQGRTHFRDDLDDEVTLSGLGDSVTLADHIDDMPAALAVADFVLAPSVRPEAFGRTAAEASAMGKPVVVSDHGGAQEVVVDGESGVRVTPGDPVALSAGLRLLLSMREPSLAAMGQAGRARVQQYYSKRGLQAATLAVYTDLIANGFGDRA